MSNERTDDFLSWRSRLEDPEGIPGQALDDREATWERLMDKLRETPRRRFSGYRIAAACLLLALIPAFRLFQGRNGNPIGPHPVTSHRATPLSTPRIARQQPAPDKPGPQTVRPTPAPVTASGRPLRAKSNRPGPPTPSLDAAPPARPLDPAPPAALLAEAPPAAVPPAIPETPAPALTTTTSNTIKHKEWKVVNIGEINSSLTPPHGTAANASRFGLGDPAINRNAGQAPQEPPGIKIKFSQN